ncbi:uncharacterized protein LOC144167832 [Haemaphysalis longicornis]
MSKPSMDTMTSDAVFLEFRGSRGRTTLFLCAFVVFECAAEQTPQKSSRAKADALISGHQLSRLQPSQRYRQGRRLDPGSAPLPHRARSGADTGGPVASGSDYDSSEVEFPPYYNYWPEAPNRRKGSGKDSYHYHRRHRQGRRRYDEFDGEYYPYDHFAGKHDYKHEYDIVFPLLILIMAPLAVSAFLLPITASLMTNTFFLVNGATSAAIQGRRRRSTQAGQVGLQSQELVELEEVLLGAIRKYGGYDKL